MAYHSLCHWQMALIAAILSPFMSPVLQCAIMEAPSHDANAFGHLSMKGGTLAEPDRLVLLHWSIIVCIVLYRYRTYDPSGKYHSRMNLETLSLSFS